MKNISLITFFLSVFLVQAQAQSIDWLSLSEAQTLAVEQDKKVMIYAEAEWCGYCKKMNKKTLPEESVQDSLSKYFYPVRIDIESDKKITYNGKTSTEKELAREFRISSTPTFIFLGAEGEIIGAQPGYMPAKIFDKLLAYVGADLTGTLSFKEYLQKHDVDIGQ